MGRQRRWFRLTRVLKGIVVALAVVFFVSLGFVLYAFQTGRAVEYVRTELLAQLDEACDLTAELEAIEVSLFPPQIYLANVALFDADGAKLASLDEAILRLRMLPLFFRRIQVGQLAVLAPTATLVVEDGRLANLPACFLPQGGGGPTPAFGVDDLQIERGKFHLIIDENVEADLSDIGIRITPGVSGGSDLAIGVDDGEIEVGDESFVIGRFRLAAHVAGLLTQPRAVSVQQLNVDIEGVGVSGTGEIDLLGPFIEAEVDVQAALPSLKALMPFLPALEGKGRARARVVGSLFDPRATGTLNLDNASIDGIGLGDALSLAFKVDRKAIDFSDLAIELADGTLTGAGRVDVDPEKGFPIKAEITAKSMPFGRVLEAVGVPGSWCDFGITGDATIEGRLVGPLALGGSVGFGVRDFHVFDRGWDRPELRRGKKLVADHVYLAFGPTEARGRWSATAESIDFHPLTVKRGSTRGVFKGQIHFTDGLKVEAELPNFDFNDIGPIAGLKLNGFGPIAGRLAGPYSDMRGLGHFEFQDTAVAGVPFGGGQGTVEWRGDIVRVSSIEGRLGRTNYEGDVNIDFSRDSWLGISGSIPRGRIEDLLVPFGVRGSDYGDPSGAVTAKFDLQGQIDALTGPVNLEMKNVSIIGEKAKSGRLVGRMESGIAVAEALEFNKYGARIAGSGWINPKDGDVRARVHTRGLRLQHLDMVAESQPELDGKLGVRVSLRGSLKGLTGTVTAALAEMTGGTMPLGGGNFVGRVRGATMDVTGAMLNDKLDVDGSVELVRGLPYSATLKLNEFDAPRLVGALNGIQLWTGTASGDAQFSGSLVDWHLSKGRMTLGHGVFEAPSVRMETSVPVKFDVADAVFVTRRLALKGPTTRLEASGTLGYRLVDLGVKGTVDLGIVAGTFDFVERSGGSLSVNARLRGSKKAIDLLGTGHISDGLLQFRGLPSRMTGATARLTFSQSTVLIDQARGRVDGGTVEATGHVLLDGYKPAQIKLETKLTEVSPKMVNPKFEMSGVMSGTIDLQGPPDHLVARGSLNARRILLRPKFDWRNIVGDPLRRLVPNVYDPTNEVLHFQIGMHLEEPMRMRNDTADVRMIGDLTMTGTNQRVGVVGDLTILDGRVGFLGREYRFERGAISMRDQFRFFPRYDLEMRARACSADITINVLGTLDDVPKPTFSSKPEMSETDVVACLVRGVRIRDLEGLSDEALSNAAVGVAGEALWRVSGVDRQVRKVIPIDQIDVITEYSARERLYEPRILIAKEIIDGRVRLEFSSSLFNTEDQSVTARYRVTPSLTLQSGWTSSEDISVGDLGLDLRYRWEW